MTTGGSFGDHKRGCIGCIAYAFLWTLAVILISFALTGSAQAAG